MRQPFAISRLHLLLLLLFGTLRQMTITPSRIEMDTKTRERVERIRTMEERLDRCVETTARLSAACKQWREVLEDSRILEEYYQGGDWMEDYEADERGELPDDLLRGVLSEDALYDYIGDRQELAKELLRTALAALES